MKSNYSLIDLNQDVFFYSFGINCWVSIRLECLGGVIVFASALLAVLNWGNPSYSSVAALSISYSLSVTNVKRISVKIGS